jgi:hypothetical protein
MSAGTSGAHDTDVSTALTAASASTTPTRWAGVRGSTGT